MVDDSRRRFDELYAARSNGRELIGDGVVWLVYELPPPAFDRRTSIALVFESDSVMRRVRTFPADWRTLSDAALYALSWSK